MAKDKTKKSPAKPVAEEQDTKGTGKLVGLLSRLWCPCQCATDRYSQQSKK